MLLVTGGDLFGPYLKSTEVLALPGGRWRKAGDLPSGTWGLGGASLNGVLHVSGGYNGFVASAEILAWDAMFEEWVVAGSMVEARYNYGVTEIPLSAIASLCSGL